MTSTTKTTKLGATGPAVFPIGLGCMGMSKMYGPSDDAESVATLQAAVDRGVTLIDTGDFYGMGHNERLVGRALAGGRRDAVVLSVKFGGMRDPSGGWVGFDARPAAVKNFCAYSLDRLGVSHIDVYRLARLDPAVPIEETVGAMQELVKAGHVRHIALSEVSAETVARAQKVAPVVDVQLEYSLASRAPEAKLFAGLAALGVGATLYGVYSRGLLTGSKPQGAGDFRAYSPRFQGDAAARNTDLVGALDAFAKERGMTKGHIALAWVLAKQPSLVPLVGARTRAQLDDALATLEKPLSMDDVRKLDALFPPGVFAGERYAAPMMAHLDSER